MKFLYKYEMNYKTDFGKPFPLVDFWGDVWIDGYTILSYSFFKKYWNKTNATSKEIRLYNNIKKLEKL